jgi:hypothetical protein
MASRIITKKGSGAPLASDLVHGELAVDTVNKRLYTEDAGGSIIELGTAPSTIDINSGTIDGTTIATSDITVGSGKTLDVSAGTLTLANDQISGDSIEGGTIGSVTITTADINGGTIDGATIGGASAAAGTFTTLNTSGAVVFNEAGADVDFRVESDTDANALFVEGSSGNVGIGTSSPGVKLEINEATDADCNFFVRARGGNSKNAALYLLTRTSGGSTSGGTIFHDGSGLAFNADSTTASERMRIDSSGNVGIGTSSPGQKLQVDGAALIGSTETHTRINSTATVGLIEFNATSEGRIQQTGAVPLTFRNNDTERMRIDSSGNVGIGTSSPAAPFEIFNASASGVMMRISNSEYDSTDTSGVNKLQFGWRNHVGASIDAFKDGTVNRTGFIINTEVGFNTAVEVMRIDSFGNVGIGTTSPAAKLEIGGAGEGIILASPDGTRYEITVSDLGVLTVTAV